MNTVWLTPLEKRQATLQKWDMPVLSGTELALRTSNLTKKATKILSEPKPKPPEPEKKDEKDGKKKKKKGEKGDEEEKQEEKVAEKEGKETEAEGAGAAA